MKQMGLDKLGEIKAYLDMGLSIKDIALKIGRDKTTIYRLFKTNGIKYKEYKTQHIGGRGGKYKNVGRKKY